VPVWRAASFALGVAVVASVQLPPLDGLADRLLVAHMAQHVVLGDIASVLIVLGLTGPVLAPVLRLPGTRPLRTLVNPLTALLIWALDLYAWHLPILYQLAIRHDLVHALEHACFLWAGILMWLALLGPLPKPSWFGAWGGIGYVAVVRLLGAVLANVLIWAQTDFYPVYQASDAARGLDPVSDQKMAGGVMMLEQVVLTTILLAWLFLRLARREEERQGLLDLAARRGTVLSDARAARAAAAGAAPDLRERLVASSDTASRRRATVEDAATAARSEPR
jgi:putative membrane protein